MFFVKETQHLFCGKGLTSDVSYKWHSGFWGLSCWMALYLFKGNHNYKDQLFSLSGILSMTLFGVKISVEWFLQTKGHVIFTSRYESTSRELFSHKIIQSSYMLHRNCCDEHLFGYLHWCDATVTPDPSDSGLLRDAMLILLAIKYKVVEWRRMESSKDCDSGPWLAI